jgi:ATP-dependent DNA helicase RecG
VRGAESASRRRPKDCAKPPALTAVFRFKALISYEGIQRIETYPFPREAIREAVANAIVHKDYSSGNPIQIRVYEDRILITNSGHFPEKWTVSELEKGVRSLPFNPSLANTFYRCGNIEAWGRGFQRMANACLIEGNPSPHYENDAQSVMLRFDASEKYLALAKENGFLSKNSAAVCGESTPVCVENCVENCVEDCVEKSSPCVENISRSQRAILEEISALPNISARQLAENTGLSPRKIQYDIQSLKSAGHLRRIGSDKTGHWEIVNEISLPLSSSPRLSPLPSPASAHVASKRPLPASVKRSGTSG